MSKTVKLTTGIRDSVLHQLLEHRFEKEEQGLGAAQEQLALDAYDLLFPDALRKQLEALPEGFVPTNVQVRVKLGDSRYYRHLNFPRGIRKRVRAADDNKVFLLEPDHPIYVRLFELEARESALEEAKDLARHQANAALNSVTTVAKLVSVWPEVAPFVQKYIDAPKPTLPALPIPSLNQMLNLGA